MTYDESNRMLTYNGEEILYDEDGNMVYGPLDGEMVTFTYDCRNRLIRAGETTYEYDAEDVRTAVETPEYREEYVTDSVTTLSRVLEVERVYKNIGEIPATSSVGTTVGTTTKESEDSTYYYGNGLTYEKNDTQGLLVYHYDHLGSTKLITDSQGNTVATYSYGTYGELLTDTTEYDISIRFLYNGELGVVTDDNGLCYMRARYYNPEIKRFINQDILTGNIGNNKSLNRYSYVEGNPISYTDPFGLSPYKAMGHAVLDVIGIFCPIADVINAAWYFLDGEAGEGIKSLVYAIPGTDIYGTLTKFTTKGSKGYKIAATTEDIIVHGGYAGTIAFASYDTGKLGGDLFEKYFVDGAEVTGETAAEIATLLLTGTQLGFSIKNGISFNGKMYADDVLDMSGVKIVNNSVTKDFWNNNGGYVNIDTFKGGKTSVKTGEVRYRLGKNVNPMEVTYDMRLNPEEYAYAVAEKYGINLKGSGQKINIIFDPYHTKGPGASRELDPTNIILGPQALISEEELARTISHELNHARSWLKGGRAPEETARTAENALGGYINGGR